METRCCDDAGPAVCCSTKDCIGTASTGGDVEKEAPMLNAGDSRLDFDDTILSNSEADGVPWAEQPPDHPTKMVTEKTKRSVDDDIRMNSLVETCWTAQVAQTLTDTLENADFLYNSDGSRSSSRASSPSRSSISKQVETCSCGHQFVDSAEFVAAFCMRCGAERHTKQASPKQVELCNVEVEGSFAPHEPQKSTREVRFRDSQNEGAIDSSIDSALALLQLPHKYRDWQDPGFKQCQPY